MGHNQSFADSHSHKRNRQQHLLTKRLDCFQPAASLLPWLFTAALQGPLSCTPNLSFGAPETAVPASTQSRRSHAHRPYPRPQTPPQLPHRLPRPPVLVRLRPRAPGRRPFAQSGLSPFPNLQTHLLRSTACCARRSRCAFAFARSALTLSDSSSSFFFRSSVRASSAFLALDAKPPEKISAEPRSNSSYSD